MLSGCNASNVNTNIVKFYADDNSVRTEKLSDEQWELSENTLHKVSSLHSADELHQSVVETQAYVEELSTEEMKSWQEVDIEVPETTEVIEETEALETDDNTKFLDVETRYLDTSYFNQDGYPVGCELVTAQMLFAYYFQFVTVDDMIDKHYIELAKFEEKDGKIYGGDPNKKFVGDPRDKHSYGCYVGAIENMFNNYIEENDLTDKFEVVDLSGIQLIDICDNYIQYGKPVMVWATIDMKPAKLNSSSWLDRDTGKEISWIAGEHCLLLIGYDNDGYYFNDPLSGKAVHYNYEEVHPRYDELGKQAITIIEKEQELESTDT